MSALPKEMPKPWDHKIILAVDKIVSDIDDESVEVAGLVATCTCGGFQFHFPENSASDVIAQNIQPHFDQHPMTPLSLAETGGDNIVLVMAVPGPNSDPVHMSISVPRETYNDGEKLGKFLGMIGSPVHFASERQRRGFYERAKEDGLHVMEIPTPQGFGIRDVLSMLDRMRGGGPSSEEPGVAMFDVPIVKPENITGFLNNPDVTIGE